MIAMSRETARKGWLRAIPKARTGPVAWVFYAAIRAVFAILQAFPLEANLATARRLARMWPRLTPRHRNRAVEHLVGALGPTRSRGEIERIADACLESWAMFAVEVICLPRLITPFTWSRYIRLLNFEPALEQFVTGRGVILVTAHYGSFEVIGHLLASLGFQVAAVMRPLDNAYLNEFVVRARRTHGLSVLDKKGAAASAEKLLEAGALLGFIGDQDAGRKGLFVDFFGRPASTYKSIGLLAMSAGCPIVVGFARRRGTRARYDVGVQRVIVPQEWEHHPDPLRWITQTYTTALEDMIRERPEQYLWIHRRWKSQPRAASGEGPASAASARSRTPTSVLSRSD
jgi:KDO2-lipid IV(A) lauroyltransferase